MLGLQVRLDNSHLFKIALFDHLLRVLQAPGAWLQFALFVAFFFFPPNPYIFFHSLCYPLEDPVGLIGRERS